MLWFKRCYPVLASGQVLAREQRMLLALRARESLPSPARIILTTHPCSSPGPMMQPVLAGTLSTVDLQRKSDS
jgi:hypothetical protein